MSAVPARFVEEPTVGLLAALAAAAGTGAVAAWTTFRLGLRRYTSGAAWSRA